MLRRLKKAAYALTDVGVSLANELMITLFAVVAGIIMFIVVVILFSPVGFMLALCAVITIYGLSTVPGWFLIMIKENIDEVY